MNPVNYTHKKWRGEESLFQYQKTIFLSKCRQKISCRCLSYLSILKLVDKDFHGVLNSSFFSSHGLEVAVLHRVHNSFRQCSNDLPFCCQVASKCQTNISFWGFWQITSSNSIASSQDEQSTVILCIVCDTQFIKSRSLFICQIRFSAYNIVTTFSNIT